MCMSFGLLRMPSASDLGHGLTILCDVHNIRNQWHLQKEYLLQWSVYFPHSRELGHTHSKMLVSKWSLISQGKRILALTCA